MYRHGQHEPIPLASLRLLPDDVADLCWYFGEAEGATGLRSPLGGQLEAMRLRLGSTPRVVLSDDEMVETATAARRASAVSRRLAIAGRAQARVLWRVHGTGSWRGLGAFGPLAGVALLTDAAKAHALKTCEAEALAALPIPEAEPLELSPAGADLDAAVRAELRRDAEARARRTALRLASRRLEGLLASASHRAATGKPEKVASERALVARVARESQTLYAGACAAYRDAREQDEAEARARRERRASSHGRPSAASVGVA